MSYLLVDVQINGTTYTGEGGTGSVGTSKLHQVWFGPYAGGSGPNHFDARNIKVGTGGYGSSDLFAPALSGMGDFGSWVGTGTDPTFSGGVMSFNNTDDRYAVQDLGSDYNEIWVQLDLRLYADDNDPDYTDVADSAGTQLAGIFTSSGGTKWNTDAGGPDFGTVAKDGTTWYTVGLHYRLSSSLTGASITLTPNAGLAGSTVSVSGVGFNPSSPLTATFNGAPVSLGGTTSTDGTGAFSGATFTVPALPGGLYDVRFSDGSDTADANFVIDGNNTSCAAANILVGVSGTNAADNSIWSGTYSAATDPLQQWFSSSTMGQRPYWWKWTNTFSKAVVLKVLVTSYSASDTRSGVAAMLSVDPCGSQDLLTQLTGSYCGFAAEFQPVVASPTGCQNTLDIVVMPGQTAYLEVDADVYTTVGDATQYGTFVFEWAALTFSGQDGFNPPLDQPGVVVNDISADTPDYNAEDFVELNGRLYGAFSFYGGSSGSYLVKLVSMALDGTDVQISEVNGAVTGSADEFLMTMVENVGENKVKFIFDGTYVYAAIPSAIPHDHNPDSAMGKNGIYTNCNGSIDFHPASGEYTYIPVLTFFRESGGAFNFWWRLWNDTGGLDPTVYPLYVGPNYGIRVEVGPSCSVAAADGVIYAHICWVVYRKFSQIYVNHWGGQPGPCDASCEEIFDSDAFWEAHAAAYKLDVAYLDSNPLYNRPTILFDNETILSNEYVSSFADCTGPDYTNPNPTYTLGPWNTDTSYEWDMPTSFANTKELVMVGDVPYLFYQPITWYNANVANQASEVDVMRLDTGTVVATIGAGAFSGASGVFNMNAGLCANYGAVGNAWGAQRAGDARCLQVTDPQHIDNDGTDSKYIVISTAWGSAFGPVGSPRVHRMDPSTFVPAYLIPGRSNSSTPPYTCWGVFHDTQCNEQWYGHDWAGNFLRYEFCDNQWVGGPGANWYGWFPGAWDNRTKFFPSRPLAGGSSYKVYKDQIVCDVGVCSLGPIIAGAGLLSWQRF
jgi:hypothetical protein